MDSDLEFWDDVKKGVHLKVDTTNPDPSRILPDFEPNSAGISMLEPKSAFFHRHVSTIA